MKHNSTILFCFLYYHKYYIIKYPLQYVDYPLVNCCIKQIENLKCENSENGFSINKTLQFLESTIVRPQSCDISLTVPENRILSSSKFFKSACKPGPWVNDPDTDRELSKFGFIMTKKKHWTIFNSYFQKKNMEISAQRAVNPAPALGTINTTEAVVPYFASKTVPETSVGPRTNKFVYNSICPVKIAAKNGRVINFFVRIILCVL